MDGYVMPYPYKMCGLDYVYLLNGYREHDTDYGKGVSIENAESLDRAICANVLISIARLHGQEVRFLRSLMHLSQTELANLIGVKRVTVARWETSPNTPIPGPADRSIRAIAASRLFEGPGCLQFVVELFPEISDDRPTNLYMVYGPDERVDEPDLFPDEKPHSDGWKPKRAA
jgi:DNA-binding transcriptional regulator YiaG